MKVLILFGFLMMMFCGYSQKEFHVFPVNHSKTPGKKTGNGTLQNPWDLQTAFNQKPDMVNGGDTIWLHQGIYTGRYVSRLKSTVRGENIVVASYKNEWATLNGNEKNDHPVATLSIIGNNVTYKDFEISPRDVISRKQGESGFNQFGGISHNSGKNCQFINLIIHGNNGLGFGSWNKTGGTVVSNCIVFDNGYLSSKGKGLGEGFYVQNDSDSEVRVIKDNIIFNNYYKGIEVWSASRNAKRSWVKNITLDNNVIFNSGLVANRTVDNIIVATDDRNSINIAKNITVTNNILYHNTDYQKNEVNGNAPSLTLGFHNKAPVENVVVKNNIVLGRNNPLRLLYAKSFEISNNIFYGGYIHVFPFTTDFLKTSVLDRNTYFTKNNTPFIVDEKKYQFNDWKSTYMVDEKSVHKHIKEFQLDSVLDITENDYKPYSYRVTLFNKDTADVTVDFSSYQLAEGTNYNIRDVENYDKILATGQLGALSKIMIPMKVERYSSKTLNNFGVYIVTFEQSPISDNEKSRESFFKRFFKWLF